MWKDQTVLWVSRSDGRIIKSLPNSYYHWGTTGAMPKLRKLSYHSAATAASISGYPRNYSTGIGRSEQVAAAAAAATTPNFSSPRKLESGQWDTAAEKSQIFTAMFINKDCHKRTGKWENGLCFTSDAHTHSPFCFHPLWWWNYCPSSLLSLSLGSPISPFQ